MFAEYREITDLLVAGFGKTRRVDDLAADDFESLRAQLTRRLRADADVQRNHARQEGLQVCLCKRPHRPAPPLRHPVQETISQRPTPTPRPGRRKDVGSRRTPPTDRGRPRSDQGHDSARPERRIRQRPLRVICPYPRSILRADGWTSRGPKQASPDAARFGRKPSPPSVRHWPNAGRRGGRKRGHAGVPRATRRVMRQRRLGQHRWQAVHRIVEGARPSPLRRIAVVLCFGVGGRKYKTGRILIWPARSSRTSWQRRRRC